MAWSERNEPNKLPNMQNVIDTATYASDWDYPIKLIYLESNQFGAKIYRDFQGRYAVKVENHPTMLYAKPLVKFHDNGYEDMDGDIYLISMDPQNINKLGKWISPQQQSTRQESASTQTRPGMLQSHLFIPPGFESQVYRMNLSNTVPKHRTQNLVAEGSHQAGNLFTFDKRNTHGGKE